MIKFPLLFALAATLLASPAFAAPPTILRETQTVVVDGIRETWQLVWIGKPISVCGPQEGDMAMTCPCAGTAYGEAGNLWLVRKRNGREIERMDLKPLFGGFDYPEYDRVRGKATLQHWPMPDSDWKDFDHPPAASTIRQRPPVHIMNLSDYDRDGRATEFLLQVGTMPCGKLMFAAVGLTRANPHLHALTSAEKRHEALMMPQWVWKDLLDGHGKSRTVTTWECGDHGSDVRDSMTVSAKDGLIRMTEHEAKCPANR